MCMYTTQIIILSHNVIHKYTNYWKHFCKQAVDNILYESERVKSGLWGSIVI